MEDGAPCKCPLGKKAKLLNLCFHCWDDRCPAKTLVGEGTPPTPPQGQGMWPQQHPPPAPASPPPPGMQQPPPAPAPTETFTPPLGLQLQGYQPATPMSQRSQASSQGQPLAPTPVELKEVPRNPASMAAAPSTFASLPDGEPAEDVPERADRFTHRSQVDRTRWRTSRRRTRTGRAQHHYDVRALDLSAQKS